MPFFGGWLKGINSGAIGDGQKDIGQDGKITNLSTTPYMASYTDIHKKTARDAFGNVLSYFDSPVEDYTSITASLSSGDRWLTSVSGIGSNLFNGNINTVSMSLLDQSETAIDKRATAYTYDQLNRLKATRNHLKSTIMRAYL